MTDYLVYNVGGELIVHSHCQDAEVDLLLHDLVPGEDVVVVSDPAREGSETPEKAAMREARTYFRGEHQDPKHEFEEENAHLRKLVADQTLDIQILGGDTKNFLSPARRREAIKHVGSKLSVPECRICRVYRVRRHLCATVTGHTLIPRSIASLQLSA
jgi:hypothetical protein